MAGLGLAEPGLSEMRLGRTGSAETNQSRWVEWGVGEVSAGRPVSWRWRNWPAWSAVGFAWDAGGAWGERRRARVGAWYSTASELWEVVGGVWRAGQGRPGSWLRKWAVVGEGSQTT
jgi:hypothetical protein